MRIIAGNFKHRQLKTPSFAGTRPMTDKVREALFNILGSDINEAEVLDLYAGTGAVGIEALSRGAAWVDFVDQSAKCTRLIKSNLELVGAENAAVIMADAARYLERCTKAYDIIFFTPPYASLDDRLAERAGRLLRESGQLVVEYGVHFHTIEGSLAGLVLVQEKVYGDTGIQLYRKL
jgi:16S rRNA (guanine966-N2)-methyltransferase